MKRTGEVAEGMAYIPIVCQWLADLEEFAVTLEHMAAVRAYMIRTGMVAEPPDLGRDVTTSR